MMAQNEEYRRRLEQEIETRIEMMERPNYHFPRRFSRRDYLLVAVMALVCLVLVLWGSIL